MSTTAQVSANQSNALQSTGPKTPEGKATSSRNATKHGFRGRLHVRPEEKDEFDALFAAHQAELNPQGPLENLVFEQIISAAWHLLRLEWAESVLVRNGDQQDYVYCDPNAHETLDTIYRYRQFHQRNLFRCLKELRALQNERSLRSHVAESTVTELPLLADSAEIAKRTQFFSSDSVLRFFHRATSNDVNHRMIEFRRPPATPPPASLPDVHSAHS